MNYILEINAFFKYKETNAISANATSLWLTLMQVNNNSGWRKQFTVARSTLLAKANLSASSFYRARTELIKNGYINCDEQEGNKASIYELVSLSSIMEHKPEDKLKRNPEPLTKQEKRKQKDTNKPTPTQVFYEDNFGKLTAYIKNELQAWSQQLNEDLVMEAMKRALEYNKVNWNYVKKILSNWFDKGIKYVEQLDVEKEIHTTKRKKKRQYKQKSAPKEVIPDWFHERQAAEKTTDQVDPSPNNVDVSVLLANYLESKNKGLEPH